MKYVIYSIAILVFLFSSSLYASENLNILSKHFDAYNRGDMEALASTIHEDIEEITYPNTKKSNSKAELLKNWKQFINDFKPVVSVKYISEIGSRIVVIEELKLYQNGELVEKVEIAEIYEFKEGQIIKAVVVDDQ